jgi:hypothetical protein
LLFPRLCGEALSIDYLHKSLRSSLGTKSCFSSFSLQSIHLSSYVLFIEFGTVCLASSIEKTAKQQLRTDYMENVYSRHLSSKKVL